MIVSTQRVKMLPQRVIDTPRTPLPLCAQALSAECHNVLRSYFPIVDTHISFFSDSNTAIVDFLLPNSILPDKIQVIMSEKNSIVKVDLLLSKHFNQRKEFLKAMYEIIDGFFIKYFQNGSIFIHIYYP